MRRKLKQSVQVTTCRCVAQLPDLAQDIHPVRLWILVILTTLTLWPQHVSIVWSGEIILMTQPITICFLVVLVTNISGIVISHKKSLHMRAHEGSVTN